ncbi:SNF2-related protein [Nannocystis pusilla]|uniref:SNF2-related protein n=1 Tax=Nannocystis pusilla TaxID=889268 RepID=UPI003BF0B7C7
MTPAQALDKLLPRWRKSLPKKYTPEFIDSFIARNRDALEAVVARMMVIRAVKRGVPPAKLPEFEIYGELAARQQARETESDEALVRRVIAKLNKLLAKWKDDEDAPVGAYQAARTFGDLQALAMVLRRDGLRAVPLLLTRPALVLVRGAAVIAVRSDDGVLHFQPGAAATETTALTRVVEQAEERVLRFRAGLGEPTSEATLRAYLGDLWAKARVYVTPIAVERVPEFEVPPDLRDRKWRTEANVRAIKIVHDKRPDEFTEDDLKALASYSGWGGLSIEAVKNQLPEELTPETFGLIHEYYTPQKIADGMVTALCPFLADLAGRDGIVRALEPSAGAGRLIRAFSPRHCLALEAGGQIKSISWTAVEFSKVSSTILRALRPDVDLHAMPFERFVVKHGSEFQGTLGLVVSNPPYGERGKMAREDADPAYQEKRAYAYFMRRALDLLVPGGIGVFLIPAGFLSGRSNRPLREKILRRHHLLGAFRLPSHTRKGQETVPGAFVVMDMVFWRSRGGELVELDAGDTFIADGDYFVQFPAHVLGKEDGAFGGEDEAGKGRNWRYKVIGDFDVLPPLIPRPVCTACVLQMVAPREANAAPTVARETAALPDDIDEAMRPGLELGRRVERYLAILGADEADKAAQLWPELHAALQDFGKARGNPWKHKPLRELADKRQIAEAQALLNAFDKSGGLVSALREPPAVKPKYTARPDDVLAQAEMLFRQRRALDLATLAAFHRSIGGTLTQEEMLAALLKAEWNLDGPAWDQLLPPDAYLTGNDLWERYDRAVARTDKGDEQARVQTRRLLDAIGPVRFEDLTDISPQYGYVPLELVSGWLSDEINARYGPITLERVGGFVQVKGHSYTDEAPTMSPEVLSFLGFRNHDPELFRPPQEPRERSSRALTREEKAQVKRSLGERRMAQAQKWADNFKKWVAAEESRREQLVEAYNRHSRGRIVPAFTPEPLEIARWGTNAPKLKPHQIAGARRVLAQRGGLVAFDVGVGKTYTALAIIARARQEGWVRRPVILVPGSLVWKWHDDVLCTLPDYRVAVIGSRRKRISRGVRVGVVTSETDTPEERAKKWVALQSGQLDVVILSYDALARTKMNDDAVLSYIQEVEAVQRSIELRRRNLRDKDAKDLTERERALVEHGVAAWVEEILALPENWEYDPGIAWDDIGIDMLVVDEAAAFKNLHKAQPREEGVPKFMGGGGEGSDRAWQLDFRAGAVRKKTGGAGIVLLTATPAKNSPLEFYNLIQFIDPTAFTKAGIYDPEQFIDRFLKIEYREVLDSSLVDVTNKPAVVGFKSLDDLRTIIFTYGEFRTAAEVGLVLPRPVVETLTITMDDDQEAKYEQYVAEIEDILENPKPDGPGFAILGLLARLSLIALHAALEDGYTYKTALEGGVVERKVWVSGALVKEKRRLPRPTYESPKLTECAKRIAASPHCGHIIFCEPTAVHQWMREVLVKHGIPRDRIAILNAEETAPADRVRIAREFNGLSSEPPAPGTCARPTDTAIPPKYDVVIANSVAYEGVDLQVRTCSIHHLDLPWTPADLEQRNGRAVRQGNTLSVVNIYYYFADGSTDGYRFSLIDGKATWLGDLIKSQVRDTNNPAAQQQLTPDDILLMISRDKEKTKRLLETKKQRQVEEARAKIAKEAARLLRQASARFRDARATTDAEKAQRLREEGEQRLGDLERVSPDAWPWANWMYAVRDTELIVPEDGGAPVFEGLRIARPKAGAPDQLEYVEFGQIVITDAGEQIGLRAAGSPSWQLVTYTGNLAGAPLRPEMFPREAGPAWPEDDEPRTADALEKKIAGLVSYAGFASIGWRGASDAFLEHWWPRFADKINQVLSRSPRRETVPVVDEEGLALAIGEEIRGATILPPTHAGWEEYQRLAPASGESFTRLREVGLSWWSRKIPPDLLSKERAAGERMQALIRDVVVPRLEADVAYRNARANSDEQNTRIEHDKALGRIMTALLEEDQTHTEIFKRWSDDKAFRQSLLEQTYEATRKPEQAAPAHAEKAPRSSTETPALTPAAAVPVGHVYQVDGGWYGDTALLNNMQWVSHIGMGNFEAKLPDGTVTFIRHSDDARLPRQSGRLHVISHSAGAAALAALLRELVESGRVEHVGTWAAFPPRETTSSPAPEPAAEKAVAHLYQIEGETYADEPILKRLAVHAVSKVDYAVGPMTLAWFRREVRCPSSRGGCTSSATTRALKPFSRSSSPC